MTDKPIRVTVLRPARRNSFIARWTDPQTGRQRSQATGHVNKRDAERFAAKLEKDLNSGEHAKRTTWAEFKRRVETEFYPEKRPATAKRYAATLSTIERELNPKLLSGINADAVAKLKAALRKRDCSPATIAAELRHLKSLLRWASRLGMLSKVPHIEIGGTEAPARGRPLTEFEFLKMLSAVKRVVGPERCESWRHLLRGLWLSGLRVSEAMAATWDDPEGIRIVLDGPYPTIRIPGRLQKGKRDTSTPLTPDFAEFLRQTPKAERRGFVFNPAPAKESTDRLGIAEVSQTVARFGRRARIVTKREPLEHASAHDLRRSFCFRWSQRVLPQVLKTLARHSSVTTTLTFYASSDTEMTAAAVWGAVTQSGVKTGDTGPDTTESDSPETKKTP